MPRQNRVTPFGELVADPGRGTLMGNRGVLHDPDGRVRRPWQLRRWILCRLEFRGRWRAVMTPGRYTALFFLDEATGLAAGHRPCAECQRDRYDDFRRAWAAAHGGDRPAAPVIDDRLHAERVDPGGSKRTFPASPDDLPDGVFVTLGHAGPAFLVRGNNLFPWSAAGYLSRRPRPAGGMVSVLTPAPTVAAIRAGYAAAVHPSAGPG